MHHEARNVSNTTLDMRAHLRAQGEALMRRQAAGLVNASPSIVSMSAHMRAQGEALMRRQALDDMRVLIRAQGEALMRRQKADATTSIGRYNANDDVLLTD